MSPSLSRAGLPSVRFHAFLSVKVLLLLCVGASLRPLQIEAASNARATVSLTPQHFRIRVERGSRQELVCNGSVSVDDGPNFGYRLDVYWEVNKVKVHQRHPHFHIERSYNPRLHVISNKLIIKNYTESLAGYYICFVNAHHDDFGEVLRASDHLEVATKYSPFIVVTDHTGDDFQQKAGETALIECGAYGSPLPAAAWYRGNTTSWRHRISRQGCRFNEEERARSRPKTMPGLVGRRYALQIDHFNEDDEGWYTCVASTDSGEQVEEHIELTVQKPPVVNAITKVTAEIGNNVTLSNVTLVSTGPVEVDIRITKTLVHDFRIDPLFEVTHESARFVRTVKRRETSPNTWIVTVVLLNVRDDDSGIYTFVVSNKAGSTRYITWLNMP